MIPDSQIEKLIVELAVSNEPAAKALKELLAERRRARGVVVSLQQSRDFFKAQIELGSVFNELGQG